jgi:putative transcriptional regulator
LGSDDDALAPGFLISLPQLQDPNFRRSVVLMTGHGEGGAQGFVVNRVLPATVPEVLAGLDVTWNGSEGEPVWGGGPVAPQSGWVLFEGGPGGALDVDAEEVFPGVHLSSSLETLRLLGQCPPRFFRLLLGYSGWGEGQLEAEIMEGSWTTIPADRDLLFRTDAEEMWGRAYQHLGIDPTFIVPANGVN